MLNYVIKRKLMIKLQGTSKLLGYKVERTPKIWKEKVESQ